MLPSSFLAIDIGSTTTKALFFLRRGDETVFDLAANENAPTTVELPTENVRVGLIAAARKIAEKASIPLVKNNKISLGKHCEALLITSSAGGGLQILVYGLAKMITAKSAYKAACVAGGVYGSPS